MSARLTLALILAAAAAVSAAPTPSGSKKSGAGAPMPMDTVLPQSGVAPTSLTPDQLKVLDDTLNKVETVVLDVESMADGGVDGTGCPPTFSVRDFMQDMKAKRFATETGGDIPEADGGGKSAEKVDWQLYFVCQALSMRNPVVCSETASISSPRSVGQVNEGGGNFSYDGKCAKSYYKERARAGYLSRSPNFLDLCKESLPHIAHLKDAASGDAVCRAWQSGNPDAFAAAIQSGMARPVSRESAAKIVAEMTVAPGACAAVTDGIARRTCKEQEEFRKAFETKNLSACNGGICRVLMGAPLAACEPYAKKFKTAACSEHYAAEFVESREKIFKSDSDQIEGALASSDAGIGDPKALKEFNARLDKLYALRARFDKAAEKVSPTTKKGGAETAPKKGG